MRPSFIVDPTNPLLVAFERGSRQFSLIWSAFTQQWTTTELLRLTEAYFSLRLIHSSAIGGYANRKLRSPAVQNLVAIGLFNQALARSVGWPQIEEDVDVPGLPMLLPEHQEALYWGRRPLIDAKGEAMGPNGVVKTFLGLQGLSGNDVRSIPPEGVEAACRALAAHLRVRLPALGVDWVAEREALAKEAPKLPALLLGETLTAEELMQLIPHAALLSQETTDELWALVDAACLSS